jgi:hypothetical protein
MSYPGEQKEEWDKQKKKTGRLVARGKYEDIGGALTRDMLIRHAAGDVTYSYTIDKDEVARVGFLDVDQGGGAALRAALAIDAEHGLTLFAIALPAADGAHDGGHVAALYDDFYPVAHINAQLRQVAEDAVLGEVEIWPRSNQGIRGLFGYHQTKRTRGELITQDGEMYDLDDPAQFSSAIELVIGLPTNTSPPEPPIVTPDEPHMRMIRRWLARSNNPERPFVHLISHSVLLMIWFVSG